MIGYVTIGTDDLDQARGFYDALLGELGASRLLQLPEEEGGFTLYGTDWAKQEPGNGNMVAFVFDERAKVDAFHARALELGGSDEGAPGLRGDPAMNFYAGYVRDPEGHKLAAFCTAPA